MDIVCQCPGEMHHRLQVAGLEEELGGSIGCLVESQEVRRDVIKKQGLDVGGC